MQRSSRTALVTGGAVSIGRAFAERLAADGVDVIVADIQDPSDTVAAIEAAGQRGLAIDCDVGDEKSVEALRSAAEDFGEIDIVVHGVGAYPIQPFAEITLEDWRQVMRVNLDSLFLVSQAFLGPMRRRGWGRIIAMSTSAFNAGDPGFAHYVAAKGGVVGLVRALAKEVAEDGVTVNSIAPSLVRTHGTTVGPHEELGMFEAVAARQAIKRTQVPEDLVGAMSFLASDDAQFMTGQSLVVDGGFVHA